MHKHQSTWLTNTQTTHINVWSSYNTYHQPQTPLNIFHSLPNNIHHRLTNHKHLSRLINIAQQLQTLYKHHSTSLNNTQTTNINVWSSYNTYHQPQTTLNILHSLPNIIHHRLTIHQHLSKAINNTQHL